MIIFDAHRYRGFSHSTDLLDHLFTVGFVTVGIDKMSIDEFLALARVRGQVAELRSMLQAMRERLRRKQ